MTSGSSIEGSDTSLSGTTGAKPEVVGANPETGPITTPEEAAQALAGVTAQSTEEPIAPNEYQTLPAGATSQLAPPAMETGSPVAERKIDEVANQAKRATASELLGPTTRTSKIPVPGQFQVLQGSAQPGFNQVAPSEAAQTKIENPTLA